MRASSSSTTINISSPQCHNRSSLTETISEKFKEIEEADTTGFLQYMDDQVHDTWDNAKAVML
ncbi:hypothetical protein CU098_002942, partial [Rhizopus stolonifer]